MTPCTQEHLKDPTKGIFGDCQRAVIACLLDLPIADVPHFLQLAEDDPDGGYFYQRIELWLAERGYEMQWHVNTVYHLKDGQQVYHQISGPSPRGNGVWHAVVGLNGKIAWDPHPSRDGLAGDPKLWQYSFLTPITTLGN